jgi:hypothetical protein
MELGPSRKETVLQRITVRRLAPASRRSRASRRISSLSRWSTQAGSCQLRVWGESLQYPPPPDLSGRLGFAAQSLPIAQFSP